METTNAVAAATAAVTPLDTPTNTAANAYPYSFTDRVVLVTGASGGLGKELATAFASAGAYVVIAARRVEEGTAVAAEINQQHDARNNKAVATFLTCDISDATAVQRCIQRTVELYGALHILVNNAGYDSTPSLLAELPDEEFAKATAVNVNGTFYAMKYAIQAMLKQQVDSVTGSRGVIVNIASRYAHVGFAKWGAYAACKHALIGLTRSACAEYAAQGIRVNAFCPGAIASGMVQKDADSDPTYIQQLAATIPAARIGTPQEFVGSVFYLCSQHAAFVQGSSLLMDGGFTAV